MKGYFFHNFTEIFGRKLLDLEMGPEQSYLKIVEFWKILSEKQTFECEQMPK